MQLVHKTNQFNLTTRRHPAAVVTAMAADPDCFAYCYRVADRFGDSGIVGVLLAPNGPEGRRIDTWLLSCRVIGRTVEDAMFAHLCGWLRARGETTLLAEYHPSDRNAPVADLLPRLGARPEGGASRFDLTDWRPQSRHARLLEDDHGS
jgi:FkbH-like protein